MYQKILAVFAVFLSLPAYAAQTKNTMKMVSYFPVPYVAYDTVSANNFRWQCVLVVLIW